MKRDHKRAAELASVMHGYADELAEQCLDIQRMLRQGIVMGNAILNLGGTLAALEGTRNEIEEALGLISPLTNTDQPGEESPF